MIDHTSQRKLQVTPAGDAGCYIMLPVEDVEKVRKLLDTTDTNYWVDEGAVSLNGGPFVTVINFPPGTKADAVQQLLDSAA